LAYALATYINLLAFLAHILDSVTLIVGVKEVVDPKQQNRYDVDVEIGKGVRSGQ